MRARRALRAVRLGAAVAASVLSASALSPSSFATEEEDSGKELFQTGLRLVAEGKVEEGCKTLFAADRLLRGVSTALELGGCWEKAQRPARAHLAYGLARARAAAGKQVDQEIVAQGKQAALEPKLGFVKFTPVEDAAGLEVRVQGSLVPREAWGRVPVEPGAFTIEVSAPGRKKASIEGKLDAAGGSLAIQLPRLEPDGSAPPPPPERSASAAPPASSAPPPAASSAPPPRPSAPMPPLRIAGLATLGGALVLAGVGAGLGGQAIALQDRSLRSCAPDGICDAFGFADRRDALTYGDASTALFVVAGATLAVGLVLVALPAPKPLGPPALTLGPGGLGGTF